MKAYFYPLFAAFAAALASCAGSSEIAKIEAYMDALRPQFAPHKVTEVVRRDSAVNPLPEVQRALAFYASQKADFEERLADMDKARAHGDDITVQIARLAAYDAAAASSPTAPLDWTKAALDSAFMRSPKDCIAVECRYTRSGAGDDTGTFFLTPDGGRVIYSSAEHIERTIEVFDALHAVEAVFDKITRR